MEIKRFEEQLSVCKVTDYKEVDVSATYVYIAHTEEENSLVCPTKLVPKNTLEREDGWKMMRIEGILDFSLIGILSRITTLLAENRIGIFAISTYNTDYILVREENYEKALHVLEEAGYDIIANQN